MNILTLPDVILIALWFLFGIKLVYDQTRLYRLYKIQIDESFPLSVREINIRQNGQSGLLSRRLQVIFSTYPNHPDVDRIAKITRYEVIAMPFVLIGMIIVLSMLG